MVCASDPIAEAAPRLLIVDDEDSIQQVCRRVLAAEGFAVATAADAQAALRHLEREACDLVLTDVAMPGPLDGLGLLDEIRRRFPATQVMLMTAYPSLETAVPTIRQGACDYLIKPFDRQQLRSALDRWRRRAAGHARPA